MKRAKEAKPVPTVLPSYIVERDEWARRAGLSIQREWGGYRNESLFTYYRGTFEQLRDSDFVTDKGSFRIPDSLRYCTKARLTAPWAPERSKRGGAFRAAAAGVYLKFDDDVPIRFGRLSAGTEYFEFAGTHVYLGSAESLIADGVAKASQLPKDGEWRAEESRRVKGWTFRVTSARRCDDGRIELSRDLECEREAAAEELKLAKEQEAYQIESLQGTVAEYRKFCHDAIEAVLDMGRRQLTHSRTGFQYTDDAVVEFDVAAGKMLATLEHGKIRFDRQIRDQVVASIKAKTAKADPQFATMMASIVGGAGEVDHG